MVPAPSSRRHTHGFTLVELLVALGIMALMAILGWRGLDGLSRAQAAAQARSDEVLTVQAALGQWNADLAAMLQLDQTQALEWDGRVLRITRRSSVPGDLGPRVVAWTRRSNGSHGIWLRWQSDPLTTRGAWQEAWARAALWAQNPGDAERRGEVALFALEGWQLFYFRGNAWTNPMSAAGTTTSATTTLPDGVRLVLDLPGGQALAGRITSDWVRPTLSSSDPLS